jgi:hypothetical protein
LEQTSGEAVNRNQVVLITFFLILYVLIGVTVAGFTDRVDGDFNAIDFLIVIAVWPIVLLSSFL